MTGPAPRGAPGRFSTRLPISLRKRSGAPATTFFASVRITRTLKTTTTPYNQPVAGFIPRPRAGCGGRCGGGTGKASVLSAERARRPVAADGDPVHHAVLVAVVVDGVVGGGAVVPDDDVAGAPAVAHAVLGAADHREEDVQERAALGLGHVLDVGGEAGVDEQAAPPGLRVYPHDRVCHRVKGPDTLALPEVSFAGEPDVQVFLEVLAAVVDRLELVGQPPQRWRQRQVRRFQVGPAGVAARGWQVHRPQHGTERGCAGEGDVGVPDGCLAAVAAVEDVDLGVLVVQTGDDRVRGGQFAECGGEGAM